MSSRHVSYAWAPRRSNRVRSQVRQNIQRFIPLDFFVTPFFVSSRKPAKALASRIEPHGRGLRDARMDELAVASKGVGTDFGDARVSLDGSIAYQIQGGIGLRACGKNLGICYLVVAWKEAHVGTLQAQGAVRQTAQHGALTHMASPLEVGDIPSLEHFPAQSQLMQLATQGAFGALQMPAQRANRSCAGPATEIIQIGLRPLAS